MASSIGQRKADHIALCATGDVGFREQTTLLEGVRFIHNALPDLNVDALDLSVSLLGKTLRAPIVIAAMTGGTDEAGTINRQLATIAEQRGYAFGLGSQRAMHKRGEVASTYRVRDVAPSTLILGNLGLVQARDLRTEQVAALVSDIGANALCVHLNPAMELIQEDGDRDFTGGLKAIERLVRELPYPVIVKETGCGISKDVGVRLRSIGVEHVDVSGAGGTSWVAVETKRAESEGARGLGELLREWGVPTAVSTGWMSSLGFTSVIATGGIGNGLDAARALALGASAVGIARPVLQALVRGGEKEAHAFLDGVERSIRAVMLLTGSSHVAALRKAPRVLSMELERWLSV